MKPGTPDFDGERLRAAREVRGKTATELAASLGVTPAAVSQYENGHQSPSPDVMVAISTRLDLPIQHFQRPADSTERLFYYRSLTSATKTARRIAAHRYLWLREAVAKLWKHVTPPTVRFPELGLPDNPLQLCSDEIEEAATILRRDWGLGDGPISNMVWLLENNGAVVSRLQLGSNKLDAFSEWCKEDQRPYIILGAEKSSAVRSRFNAAHETAHMVLHRRLSRSDFGDRHNFKTIENQAHRMAGAFLLPRRTFQNDLYAINLDALKSLKKKWKVSIAAMIMRCRHLDCISREQEKRLFINLARRGWNRHEPFDDSIELETPCFARQCVELLLNQGIVTTAEMPSVFGLNLPEIEELFGLEPNALSSRMDAIPISPPTPELVAEFHVNRAPMPKTRGTEI